ncbi:LysE family translocator [Salinicola sp. CPA57]|uniref:LysE family translocator n=1 Tax=Salinicola sp. CPA57 TaxID=1949080 RepID=UPI0018E51A57|nr:LysE family translocator [Salinicola sp. CPA57]
MTEILPLLLFVVTSTMTPGGATTLATASGAHFGYRRSLPLMGGIAVGLGSMGASTAAGLGAILLALPSIQVAMKALGSLYLLWLAWKIAQSPPPHAQTTLAKPTRFLGGIWLLWHNPKGWAMTLSAAASFATLASGPIQLGALLGLSFGLAAFGSLTLWCAVGLLLARLIRTDQQWRLVNMTLGALLGASIIPMWFE